MEDLTPIVNMRSAPGVLVVQCESSAGGEGVVPGEDPSSIHGRTIVIEDDPENPQGERFTLVIDGPNDPDVVAATAKIRGKYTGLSDAPAVATAIYREAAMMKNARRAATTNGFAAPAAQTTSAPPLPTPTKPRTLHAVSFLFGDQGEVSLQCEEILLAEDTLVLVSGVAATQMGVYTPPRSVPGQVRPLSLSVEGVDGVITAYMLHAPYLCDGRRHLVLAVDG